MTDPLLDKTPPHSIEVEQALLGALMLFPDDATATVDQLVPDDFYVLQHRILFGVLAGFLASQEPFDLHLFVERLRQEGKIEEAGGKDYIIQSANEAPGADIIEYYARLVLARSKLRQIMQAGAEMIRDAGDVRSNPDEVLDRCEQRVFAIAERGQIGGPVPIGTILKRVIGQLAESGSLDRGVETGYVDLDDGLRGLHRGDLVILGARPSIGKSALALNIAENVVVKQNRPVALFSMEMNQDELAFRLIASQSAISAWRLRRPDLAGDRVRDAASVAEKMGNAPLYIDDTAALHITELKGRARRLISRHGVELIIVDYLQLIHGVRRKGDNREQEVASVSRALKILARECNVPVLALAQLRRGAVGVQHKPRLSDLRESGAQEQDSDVVLLLHREKTHGPESNRAELIIAKNRHGPTTRIWLTWQPDRVRFQNEAPGFRTPEPQEAEDEQAPF